MSLEYAPEHHILFLILFEISAAGALPQTPLQLLMTLKTFFSLLRVPVFARRPSCLLRRSRHVNNKTSLTKQISSENCLINLRV